MASETQSGGEIFKQDTRGLLASIDFNANDRGMCLSDALIEMGLSPEAQEQVRNCESVSEEDSEKIFTWLQGDQEPGTIHPDSMEAIVHMLGGPGAKEAIGFAD